MSVWSERTSLRLMMTEIVSYRRSSFFSGKIHSFVQQTLVRYYVEYFKEIKIHNIHSTTSSVSPHPPFQLSPLQNTASSLKQSAFLVAKNGTSLFSCPRYCLRLQKPIWTEFRAFTVKIDQKYLPFWWKAIEYNITTT